MTTQPRTRLRLMGRVFVGFEQALAAQAAFFQQSHPDVDIEMNFLDPQELYERAIAREELREGQIDIVLALTDWLPEAIGRGLLAPLAPFLRKNAPDSWPHGWSPSLLGLQQDAAGQTYALPYHDGPMMLIYRRDLFDNPQEQARFRAKYDRDLQPPETWAEYLQVAEFFNRPDQGLAGAVSAGLNDAHNNVYDFMLQTWSRGGRMLDEQGQPAFAEPIARDALQFHVDLFNRYRVIPSEAKKLDSVASGEYYAAGRAAMTVNWCGFATMAEVPEHSQVVGKNGLGLVPRGDGPGGVHTSINVYWVLGIAAGSSHQELAYEFLRSTASPAMDLITAQNGCIATRLSTWRDPDILRQFPVYATIDTVHRQVHSPPPIAEWPAIVDILNVAVDDALYERKSVSDALSWAATEARAILRSIGQR